MTPVFGLLFDMLDDRLRLRRPGSRVANKVFPHNWSFLLGEVALFSLVVLVLTGTFLTMFYRPSTNPVVYTGSSELFFGRELPAAFESVTRLSNDVPGGLFFRRLHRGASHLFIAASVLHMLRIVLTGAFRKPREVNYLVGIGLMTLSLAEGFVGYSLPYDSLAGSGIRIAYSELLSFPFVGDRLAFWIFGGEFPTGDTIPRFFAFHVMVLPAIILALVGVHLAMLVRQRHTQFPRRDVDGHRWVLGKPLWPTQTMESITLMLWIGGLLALAAVLIPWSDVELLGPYRPGEIGNNAQPDWFMFWADGALRIFPPFELQPFPGLTISGPFFAGIVVPGIIFTSLALYPWLERWFYGLQGDWHVLQNPLEIPLRAGFMAAFWTMVLLLSSASTSDIQSRMFGVTIETVNWFYRFGFLLIPPAVGVVTYRYSQRRIRRREVVVARSEAGVGGGLAARGSDPTPAGAEEQAPRSEPAGQQ